MLELNTCSQARDNAIVYEERKGETYPTNQATVRDVSICSLHVPKRMLYSHCRVWARAASLCVNGKLLDGGGAMVGRSFYEAVNAARKAVIVFARSRCAVEKWSCARKRVGKLVVRKMAGSLNAARKNPDRQQAILVIQYVGSNKA
jgi:hypothetical protein